MPKCGYTLFELMLVLALISFLSLLSIQYLADQSSSSLFVELNRLESVIRYLQRKALLEGTLQKLVFLKAENGYTADSKHLLRFGVRFAEKANIQVPPSDPKHSLREAITFPESAVFCYPDGTISAGAVYLTNGRMFVALTCDASSITGIRRYILKESWQIL